MLLNAFTISAIWFKMNVTGSRRGRLNRKDVNSIVKNVKISPYPSPFVAPFTSLSLYCHFCVDKVFYHLYLILILKIGREYKTNFTSKTLKQRMPLI